MGALRHSPRSFVRQTYKDYGKSDENCDKTVWFETMK